MGQLESMSERSTLQLLNRHEKAKAFPVYGRWVFAFWFLSCFLFAWRLSVWEVSRVYKYWSKSEILQESFSQRHCSLSIFIINFLSFVIIGPNNIGKTILTGIFYSGFAMKRYVSGTGEKEIRSSTVSSHASIRAMFPCLLWPQITI